MKIFKTKLLIAAVFITEIILLILCAGKAYEKSGVIGNELRNDSRSTIRILHDSRYAGAANTAMYEMFSDYSRENKVSVTCDSLYGADFFTKLYADFSQGNEPDIVITSPGYNMEFLYKANKLALLQEDISKDKKWYDSLDKSTLKSTSRDNNIYGIPMKTEYFALYSNKAILKKYNLDVPANFESLGRLDSQQMFLNEEAPFIVESSSFANAIANFSSGNYLSDDKFEISAFPIPDTSKINKNLMRSTNQFPIPYGVGGLTLFVSKTAYDTKHGDVIKLLKYITSKKSALALSEESGSMSAIKSVYTLAKETPTFNIIVERNLLIGKSTKITPIPDRAADKYIWYSRINSRLADIITGRADAESVLGDAAALFNSAQGGLK